MTTTPETIHQLPLEQLAPSPFNPRQIFTGIEALAENIRAEGRIHEPLLVRPTDYKPGYELVFGHRRLRAAAIAGLASVPCMVRAMTDAEVRSAQVAENLQREDVHPFEEAEGFRMIIAAGDATADELAERFGKSRSYVYGRLKLLQACKEVRNACLAGDISAEVALLVARLRTDKLQEKALAAIKANNISSCLTDGGKQSYRRVRDLLVERFTLDLNGALFSLTNDALHPEAGTCAACPKRSGNAPEFDDVASAKKLGSWSRENVGANVCTDPDCWAIKTKAHLDGAAVALQGKGKTVIAGAKARSAIDARGKLKPEFVPLKDVREALKKAKGDAPQVLTILDPRTSKTIDVVKAADLVAAGIRRAAPKPDKSNDHYKRRQAADQKKVDDENARRVALAHRVHVAAAAAPRSFFDLRLAVRALLADFHGPSAALYEWWVVPNDEALLHHIDTTMSAEELALLMIDLLMLDRLTLNWVGDLKRVPKTLIAVAAHYGVQAQASAPETPTPLARAAKKAASKKPKATKKDDDADDAVAERDPNTADMFEGEATVP
jgi:ParB/RepB/Spo0J family partition protein